MSSVLVRKQSDDGWVCPSDRHLSLRAKLNSGWSVRTSYNDKQRKSNTISEEEMKKIQNVIDRAEKADATEQKRVGAMVHRLDSMRGKCIGDGVSNCLLCAEGFGKFVGTTPILCMDCKKNVCNKCSVEYTSLAHQHPTISPGIKPTTMSNVASWLCKICSESRKVWKRSGAWFFRSLPRYVLPEAKVVDVPQRYANHRPLTSVSSLSSENSKIPSVNVLQSSNGIYSHYKSVGRRRSTSSESSDSETTDVVGRQRNYSGDTSNTSSYSIGVSNHLQPSSPSLSPSLDDDNQPGSAGVSRQNSRRSAFKQSMKKNLDIPGVRRRRMSGGRRRMKNASESDAEVVSVKSEEAESPLTQKRNIDTDLSSLRSSGTKSPIEETSMPNSPGRTYIEKIDPAVNNSGPLGSLEFTVLYDPPKLALFVTVIRARNLKSTDINGLSDPYVKLHLLPGSKKSSKLRTKTKHRTLNPNFDETLTYWGITENDIARKRLRLTVLDEDRFGHNDFIGEVSVTLRHLTPMQTKSCNMALGYHQVSDNDDEEDAKDRGRIFLTLYFDQRNFALVLTVVRCAGLVPVARSNAIDPHIKACLHMDESASSDVICARTERSKATKNSNPAFNDVIRLPIVGGAKELVKCHLDVSAWDKDALGRDHLIGALHFGINSKGDELRHWFDCIKNPDKSIDMWHQLVMPDDPATISALSAAGKRRRTPRPARKSPM